ncbi:MAG: hypothetical protein ACRCUP_03820 [Mycoplasmatales bacterium]
MNNIYFICRRNLKEIVYFVIATALFLLVYLSIYPTFKEAAQPFVDVLNSLPKTVVELLKINPETMFTYEGFIAFTMNFVYLFLAIFSAKIAYSIMLEANNNRLNDYLFAKPISRITYNLQKFVAVIICNLIFVCLLQTLSYALISFYGQLSPKIFSYYSLLTLGFCLSVSLLACIIAVFIKRFKQVATLGIVTALLLFLQNFLANSLHFDLLKSLSVWDVFAYQKYLEIAKLPTAGIWMLFCLFILTLCCVVVDAKREVKWNLCYLI